MLFLGGTVMSTYVLKNNIMTEKEIQKFVRILESYGEIMVDKVIKQAANLFYVGTEYVRKIFDNLENINIKPREKLIFGIGVEIKINNDGIFVKLSTNLKNLDFVYIQSISDETLNLPTANTN